MGFRFRKSINLGGGLKINLSKSGIGFSWGFPGFRISRTAKGKIKQTFSIPGTGISYEKSSSSKNKVTEDKNPQKEEKKQTKKDKSKKKDKD